MPFNKKLFFILGFLLLVFGFHYFGFLRPLESFLAMVMNPVEEKIFNLTQGVIRPLIISRTKLLKENKELRNQLKILAIDNAELSRLRNENTDLKAILKFKDLTNLDLVTAKVIAFDSLLPNTFIINQGTRQGIKNGLPVVSTEGILVGRVSKNFDNTAAVTLITDPTVKITAKIARQPTTLGVLTGENLIGLRMFRIETEKDLMVGDLVVTAGLEEEVPSDLVIGIVRSVITKPGSLFKQAQVDPLLTKDNLRLVNVILPTY